MGGRLISLKMTGILCTSLFLCRDDSFSSRSKTRSSCLISLGNKDPLKSFLDSSVQGEGGVIIQVPIETSHDQAIRVQRSLAFYSSCNVKKPRTPTHRGYIPIMNLTASYTAVTFST